MRLLNFIDCSGGNVARSRSAIFIVSTVFLFQPRFVSSHGEEGRRGHTFFFDGETEFHFEERS